MRAFKIIAVLLLGACAPVTGLQVEPSEMRLQAAPSLSTALEFEAASRGRAMAIIGCASCHAIDASGNSALAAAPPFRDIVLRRGLDDLTVAFEQGLVTTHPAMPPYVFRASEIHDLTAYLGTLRTAPEGTSNR